LPSAHVAPLDNHATVRHIYISAVGVKPRASW